MNDIYKTNMQNKVHWHDIFRGGVNRNLYSQLLTKISAISMGLLGVLFANTCFAQDCSNVSENPEWLSLFQKMNQQVQSEKYEDALKTIGDLIEICPTMPSVNYAAGKIYQKLDNPQMAHSYYRVATENTKQFIVNKDLMKDMWYARYETEFPEVLDFKSGKVTKQHQAILEVQKEKAIITNLEDIAYANTVMWTGAGVGIAGLVIAAVGGALMAPSVNGIDEIELNGANVHENRYDLVATDEMNQYIAGTAMLGVGLGVAVAGAIMAGVGGYRYTNSKTTHQTKEDLESDNKHEMNFSLSYNHVAFGMTF